MSKPPSNKLTWLDIQKQTKSLPIFEMRLGEDITLCDFLLSYFLYEDRSDYFNAVGMERIKIYSPKSGLMENIQMPDDFKYLSRRVVWKNTSKRHGFLVIQWRDLNPQINPKTILIRVYRARENGDKRFYLWDSL